MGAWAPSAALRPSLRRAWCTLLVLQSTIVAGVGPEVNQCAEQIHEFTRSEEGRQMLLTAERLQQMADVWPSKVIHVGPRGKDGDGQEKYWPQSRGDPAQDPHYYAKAPIIDGSVVWLYPQDVAGFIRDRFSSLPKNVSIVLVTGLADCGAPLELFTGGLRFEHPPQFVFKDDATTSERVANMLEFIMDPRLKHWYAQNYDLVGCGPFTGRSPVPDDHPARLKVSALPIGPGGLVKPPTRKDDCSFETPFQPDHEDKMLRQLGAYKPWALRSPTILDTGFPGAKFKLGRAQCKKWLGQQPHRTAMVKAKDRPPYYAKGAFVSSNESAPYGLTAESWAYFGEITAVQFVLCPLGHGVDTHRFYETLSLGAVPVVISTPLDAIVREFPAIIVKRWHEVAAPDALFRWNKTIVERWGAEPINAEVRNRLHLGYYRDMIRAGKPLHPPPGATEVAVENGAKPTFPACVIPECQPGRVGPKYSRKAVKPCRTASLAWKGVPE